MRFAASITAEPQADQALRELLGPIEKSVTPGMVDLAVVFVTAHFEDELGEIVDGIGEGLPNAVLIGCTAEGTIGPGKELERTPSISLLAASLPEARIRPFHIRQQDVDSAGTQHDASTGVGLWERIVAVAPESTPVFVALADPFRLAVHEVLDQINTVFPGAPMVGGVASAGHQPGQNRLILNGEVHRSGMIGVAMTGPFSVDTVVSQGCRPIGKPFVITKGARNIVYELGGKAALNQLHEVIVSLSEEDEQLARQSLLLGRVIDEYKDRFSRGDFLIHNIIGADRSNGAMAIAGHARVGATVQFHVRDATSADEDLRSMLAPHIGRNVKGALLFGCNGRGSNMWPRPGHDVGVLQELLGDVPVAGFFCGGEFGPVSGKNFVHGFTASIALFRENGSTESSLEDS